MPKANDGKEPKMRKLMLIAGLFALTLSGTAFAGQRDYSTVKSSELKDGFVAAKPVKMIRPERVFYMNEREIKGYVTLEMTVSEKGVVENAHVLYRTSQLAVMKAVEAAEKWSFEPATLDGVPVRSTVTYNLPFGLELNAFAEEKADNKVFLQDDQLALVK